MRCLCGCERRLARGQSKVNLLGGEVALELIVWDKARSLRSPVAAEEIEALIDGGAPLYQEVLAHLHGGREPDDRQLAPIRQWLERSREARRRLSKELPVVPKKKTKLSDEDLARVDRVHPERSFSGVPAAPPAPEQPAPAAPAAAPEPRVEPVDEAARLEALLIDALVEVRSGRVEEAEAALRRFLSGRG